MTHKYAALSTRNCDPDDAIQQFFRSFVQEPPYNRSIDHETRIHFSLDSDSMDILGDYLNYVYYIYILHTTHIYGRYPIYFISNRRTRQIKITRNSFYEDFNKISQEEFDLKSVYEIVLMWKFLSHKKL